MEASTPEYSSLLGDSIPLGNDHWQSIFAQCTAHDDQHHPYVESGDGLFADASIDDLDLDLNVDLDPSVYLDTLGAGHPNSFGSVPVPLHSGGLHNHDEPTLDCSTLPSTPLFAAPDSIPTPVQTPPQAAAASCHLQDRTPCIITATQSLRSLHIPQTNCVSRRNASRHDRSGLEPPRMSGSVLKANKDAGMSVCRMLQCTCALRPQNQLILAIICSRLVAWYRAMIRACFMNGPNRSSGHSVNSGPNEARPSLEKVVHQPVTIGDHSVDDQALGLTIQAQVMLGELKHMQRLVETLSARMRETANSYPKEMQGVGAEAGCPSTGLPDTTHDRLVSHLLKEVHAAKADLITAWASP
ncbi:Aflatoxin regulatory protein [Penicillium camemberti]|uniref:Aflatoxin regulatory protein n=1 Tax=Penicillium camemberti (strain FM 013) TaxID=1429867 RepID=A0A0G4PLL2_PENC3|nr:Aflatoxin regulatory protein [Penicillium camemberti]